MPPEIFSFLQTQFQFTTQLQGQNIIPPENTGTMPGMFDALMAEYKAQNEAELPDVPEIADPQPEPLQPAIFGTSKIIPPEMEIAAGDTVREENVSPSSWRNLFADVKRAADVPGKTQEVTAPQNDFDEGIVAVTADTEPETLPPENSEPVPQEAQDDTQSQALTPDTVIEHEDISPESKPAEDDGHIPHNEEIPEAETEEAESPELPEARLADTRSDDAQEIQPREARPEIPEASIPEHPHEAAQKSQTLPPQENDDTRPAILAEPPERPEIPDAPDAVEDHHPEIPEAQRLPDTAPPLQDTPEIPQRQTAQDDPAGYDTSEKTDSQLPAKDNETPAPKVKTVPAREASQKLRATPGHQARVEAVPVESHETVGNEPVSFSAGHEADYETPVTLPETRNVVVADGEESAPEIPAQYVPEEHKTERENENDPHEIPADNSKTQPAFPEVSVNMAANAVIQPSQPEHPAPVATYDEVPEIADSTQSPRNRQQSPQRMRDPKPAAVQEAPQEITGNTQETDTAPHVPARDQDSPGEISRQEAEQPSPSAGNDTRNDGTDSPAKVPASQSGISRATSRTDRPESRNNSRTDTRKIEALSDFQSFFDGAMRAKRTSSRVNTQPLSLRTGTYGASGIQSQAQTLRNGIVNTVRFIRADGVRKANIIVDPPALGRISVELTSSTSGVEASVKVASEQIRQVVQEQISQLRENLAQQGVQVSEFTVDVQQDNSRQGQDSGSQNQRNQYSYTASDDDDDTETFRADLEEGLLYWIA